MLPVEGTEGLRADISDRIHLRDLPVALVTMVVSVVWFAAAVAAPSPAAASTTGHAPTSLYRLSLRISSKRFLGGGTENPIAVDRYANVYAFKATRTQQGSIPSGDAPDVEKISPAGRLIRSFSTTFRVRGQRRYLQVDGLAVTPNGRDVFVVGNVSKSLSGLVDSRPLLAKYSASTGALLRSYGFDGDGTRLGVGVAVDPSGRHVYVGDERNPFVGRTTARIYEFDAASLHELRRFGLAGNDVCCDLAVTPDGHLFAQVGPPHSTQVLLQEYSSTGGYENQFSSPPGGLAVGPTGDLFVGSRTEHRIDRLSRTGKLLETLGAGHFSGLPLAGAVNRAGDVFAFDAATNDVSTMLKFAPVVPQTTITAHPPATLVTPSATFRFKSSLAGAKLECRLRKAGASPPAFKPCSSPKTYPAQPSDSYTFEARSTSPAGPVDPTPAKFTFKVVYPATAITSTPARTIGTTTATFAFKSSSAGATFRLPTGARRVPSAGVQEVPEPCHLRSAERWSLEVRGAIDLDARADRPDAGHLSIQDRYDAADRYRAGCADDPGGRPAAARWNARGPGDLVGNRHVQSVLRSAVHGRATHGRDAGQAWGRSRICPRWRTCRGRRRPWCRSHRVARCTSCACGPRTSSALPPRALQVIRSHSSVIDDGDRLDHVFDGLGADHRRRRVRRKASHHQLRRRRREMTFTGRSIAVIAPVGPTSGAIQVCIDSGVSVGICTTVSEHSATAVEREVVYVSAPVSTTAPHTISITSTTSSTVALDGFAVLG